jgi:hypothetical protein
MVEAEELLERALSIREKALGKDDPGLVSALEGLATLRLCRLDFSRAKALTKRILRIEEKTLAEDDPDVAGTLAELAWIEAMIGNDSEAELLYVRAIAVTEKALGPDHKETKRVRSALEEIRARQDGEGSLDVFLQHVFRRGEPSDAAFEAKYDKALKELWAEYGNQSSPKPMQPEPDVGADSR